MSMKVYAAIGIVQGEYRTVTYRTARQYIISHHALPHRTESYNTYRARRCVGTRGNVHSIEETVNSNT